MTGPDDKVGYYLRGADHLKVGLALCLFFAGVIIALAWPSAGAARDDLRKLYGSRAIRIVSIKTNNFEEACGQYTPPEGRARLRFLEQRDGLWAERPGRDSANDPDIQKWDRCMARWRRHAFLDSIADYLVVQIMRVT